MKKLISFLFFLALIMLSMVNFDSDAQNNDEAITSSSYISSQSKLPDH